MRQSDEASKGEAELLDYYRGQVAASCRILAQHGLVKGSTGHVSRRVPGTDDILIRGRPRVDKGLRFAEPSSIIRVSPDAQPVGDTRGVNRVSEIYMHTEAIKRRPDVNCVIHAHPPGVLLCTMHDIPLREIFGGYDPGAMNLAKAGLPVYDRSITLVTLDETNPMLDLMGENDAILLSRHGVVITGRSVEEATARAISLETLARLTWMAWKKGDPGEITALDKEEWSRRARVAAEARARGAGGESRGNWEHYMAILESGELHYDDIGFSG